MAFSLGFLVPAGNGSTWILKGTGAGKIPPRRSFLAACLAARSYPKNRQSFEILR